MECGKIFRHYLQCIIQFESRGFTYFVAQVFVRFLVFKYNTATICHSSPTLLISYDNARVGSSMLKSS